MNTWISVLAASCVNDLSTTGKDTVLFSLQTVEVLRRSCAYKLYTLCPKKTCDYIFYNNFYNKCLITIIFGAVSSKSMRH